MASSSSENTHEDNLDDIQYEIEQRKKAISAKEKQCVQLLDDSLEVGIGTCDELHSQGEKLTKISKKLTNIEAELINGDDVISRMDWRKKHPFISFFYVPNPKRKPMFTLPWTSGKTQQQTSGQRSNMGTQKTGDEFVDAVGPRIAMLKELALNMSDELDGQNDELTTINEHTEHIKTKVTKSTWSIGKLL